jgi:hypothetical protein
VSDAFDDKTLASVSIDDTAIAGMSIMIIDDDLRRAVPLEQILTRAGCRRVIRATRQLVAAFERLDHRELAGEHALPALT